ncbi:hypothetical protein, partial [Fictibacillus fluitans]
AKSLTYSGFCLVFKEHFVDVARFGDFLIIAPLTKGVNHFFALFISFVSFVCRVVSATSSNIPC